jgi:23S rRNA (cytidine2498-2'-O)-methyltransferase
VSGAIIEKSGRGWVLASSVQNPDGLCFAHLLFKEVTRIDEAAVNAQGQQILDSFLSAVQDRRIDEKWPLLLRFADGEKGLGQRVKKVEKVFEEKLKKRLGRIAKLADHSYPANGNATGLFIFFVGFDELYITTEAFVLGSRRMADDPAAPSRSYLKTEEAFMVYGIEPVEGETVVDLGAAPGGWSYSAAKRGGMVTAIDNGPMKGGALDHPRIQHQRADAFKFKPADGERYDWLLCDLVEEPHHVMRMIRQWFENGWCRQFVINFKFGRADAVKLISEVRDGLGPLCETLVIRHLFHDRDEFTIMGKVKGD